MNDERMAPVLRAWLKQRAVPPEDPSRTAAHVAARLPRVRQRRRWRLPRMLGRSRISTVLDQERPRLARNPATVLIPSTTGRTQTVFSPIKAVTAGALVLAFSATFLVAQPFDRPGGVAPVPSKPRKPCSPLRSPARMSRVGSHATTVAAAK